MYNSNNASHKSMLIAEEIKAKVKALHIPRYKIVCLVHIGSIKGQDVKIASRCVWTPDWDTYVSHSFESKTLFAVATVYGVYFE